MDPLQLQMLPSLQLSNEGKESSASSIVAERSNESKESSVRLLMQPDGEIFHVMISYRVNTDADLAIHDRLHFKALNAKKKLDFYAAAKYPSVFNRAR